MQSCQVVTELLLPLFHLSPGVQTFSYFISLECFFIYCDLSLHTPLCFNFSLLSLRHKAHLSRRSPPAVTHPSHTTETLLWFSCVDSSLLVCCWVLVCVWVMMGCTSSLRHLSEEKKNIFCSLSCRRPLSLSLPLLLVLNSWGVIF